MIPCFYPENQMVNNELGLLLEHMDPTRGRIFWRSFGITVASSTPSMVWLDPTPVDCEGDRVLCYFSTWIVHLKVNSRCLRVGFLYWGV